MIACTTLPCTSVNRKSQPVWHTGHRQAAFGLIYLFLRQRFNHKLDAPRLQKVSPRLSPDGNQLAYLAPVNGVLNVWVGPSDKPEAAKAVTADKKRGIRIYYWAYTNEHLLYLQDSDGDEDYHVYRVDLQKGETK